MLLERPLSLQLIFHNYNQFKTERDRSYMNEQSTYISCFFSFFSLFCCWFVLVSCFLFSSSSSSSFLPARCIVFFFSFCSFRSGPFLLLLMVCSCFYFFLLLSIPAFFFVPLRWCRVVMLKIVVYGNQVLFESLKNSLAHAPNRDMLYCHLHIYMFMQHHNDTIIKTHDKDARRLL